MDGEVYSKCLYVIKFTVRGGEDPGLSEFNFSPDASLKEFQIWMIVLEFLESALANRVRSSTKKKWEILGPDMLILIGSHCLV